MRTFIDESETQEDHGSRNSNQGADREISLGTTTILLIFFALAASHAAVFGFGYSLASKHSESTAAAAQPASSSSFNAFKPAAGSPVGSPSPGKPSAATEPATAIVPINPPATAPVESPEPKVIASASDFEDGSAKSKAPASPPAAAPVAATPSAIPVAPNGTVVVQVAAVSHQEDADLIASTLKRRGYVVNIRTEADKLLHVQVGPFATRKDAEAMKAKLLADGFNAYIK